MEHKLVRCYDLREINEGPFTSFHLRERTKSPRKIKIYVEINNLRPLFTFLAFADDGPHTEKVPSHNVPNKTFQYEFFMV